MFVVLYDSLNSILVMGEKEKRKYESTLIVLERIQKKFMIK